MGDADLVATEGVFGCRGKLVLGHTLTTSTSEFCQEHSAHYFLLLKRRVRMSVRLRQGGKRTKRRRPQGHSAAASSGGAELQRSVANTHSRTRQGKPNTGGKGEERAASGGDVCALLESCHTRHAEESELSGSPRADLMSTCHPSDDDANVFDRRYACSVSPLPPML